MSSPVTLPENWKDEAVQRLVPLAGQIVVVKVGGEILESPELALAFAEDILALKAAGIAPIVCHGGGPQVSKAMAELGKEPVFVNGRRVTDAETLEITASVFLGILNRRLVSLLNTTGAHAVGLSGIDFRLLEGEQRDPALGFVGEVRSVNTVFLRQLLASFIVPVIAPLAIGKDGATLNVNADTVAGEIAAALPAHMLALLTNVAGLLDDVNRPESLVPSLTAEQLQGKLDAGALQGGMIPKAEAALLPLDRGCQVSYMLDGRVPHAVLLRISGLEEFGTTIHT